MADSKSSLGKKLLLVFGVLVVLLVVAYFVVTSTAFFKSVILPKVSKSVGAEITVADASISPFSRVELENLKVQPPGAEPLLQAERVVARYSLMDIIGGNINVHEVTLTSPIIKIVENEKGNSNLDPVTKSDAPAQKKEEGEPPKLDIKNVTLKNATVQLIKKHAGKPDELTELANLNLHIDQLKNGQSGKMEISSDLKMQSTSTNGTPNLLAGALNGNFAFALAQNLLPENAKGNAKMEVKNVGGDYADLAGLSANLTTDISPTDIKSLALQFSRRGEALGQIRASGPFDVSKQEGKLSVELASIDRNVLNIVGASKGIDFGQTKINSTNQIELSKAGAFIAVNGGLRADAFSITQTNQTTPKVDIQANYSVALDTAASNAVIQAFTLNGTQNKKPLLRGALSQPMKLDWGKEAGGVDESAFELTVTNLNLADWKAFAAELNPAGKAGVKLTIVSHGAGQNIQFDFDTRLQDFSGTFGSNKIDRADISVVAKGQIAGMDKLNLEQSRVEFAQNGKRATTATASGTYAIKSGEANLQADLDADLPALLRLAEIPDIEARSGKVTFKGKIEQKKDSQVIDGKFALADFTGRYGEYRLQEFTVSSVADIEKNMDMVQIRRLIMALQQGKASGGTVEMTGNYNLKSSVGALDLKLNELNETAVRPFVAPSLGERELVSILINGKASANLNSTNSTALQADLNVTRLVIADPGEKTPPAPLTAKLRADISLQNEAALQIRAVDADVTYGGKPAGKFTLAGNYNLSNGVGDMELNLADLNQNAVKVVMPKVGEKDLVTISISGNASANLNSTNDSAIKADFKIADLVVKDPKKPQADPPLTAQIVLDAAMAKQMLELRKAQLTLSPTPRANNQIQVKGKMDLSNTNAYSGQLTLSSDGVDVTSFYDLYAGGEQPAANSGKAAPQKGTATPEPSNEEPEAVKLPIGKMTVDVNVEKFFLREVAITNLNFAAELEGSKVTVKQSQFALNGAPVKANIFLDLGVRGYRYNLFFSVNRVPLAPLANSFMENTTNQYQGDIIAHATVKGVGTTGVNLRKSLAGNMNFTFTNANIQVVGPKARKVMVPIAKLLKVPEITESPVSWVDAKVLFGEGAINLDRCIIESEAFRGDTTGTIPIADVLTNSPINKFPVNFHLRRSLAERSKLLPANTPEEVKYVSLPTFATLKGTLGEPDVDLKESVILALLAQSSAGYVGGDAGKVLQGIGGILGGQRPVATNAPPGATNQTRSATNQAPANIVPSLLDQFLKKDKDKK